MSLCPKASNPLATSLSHALRISHKIDLRSDPHHRLHRRSHTPQELVERFLRDVAGPKSEWTPRQMAAVAQGCRSFCRKNSSNVPSEARMTELIQIISDMFFFGKLSRCRFEWHESLFIPQQGQKALGLCYSQARYSRDWCTIQMDATDQHLQNRLKSHFTAIMGVLLHECVHALFQIYSCWNVCRSQECSKTHRRALGKTGHGEAWFIVASHVEALARKYILQSVRVLIPITLCHEWRESGLIAVNEAAEAQCHPYSRRIFRQFRSLAEDFE